MGIAYQKLGRVQDAAVAFEDAAAQAERDGPLGIASLAKYHLASIAYMSGELDKASKLEGDSARMLEELQDSFNLAHNLLLRSVIALARGEIRNGRELLGRATSLSESYGDAINVRNCRELAGALTRLNPKEGTPLRIGLNP
jgi:hypothetical protein